jgi:hypothetical protein
LLLAAAVLALGLGACSGETDAADSAPGGIGRLLPAVSTLDSLGGKSTSALVDSAADVGDALAAEFSAGGPGGWIFQNQPFHSWVLYRLAVPPAANRPLAIRVLGSSRLWMIVGDFSTGRWVRPKQLSSTLTQYDLTQLGAPVSPAGNVYVGFVLTQSTGGIDDRIQLLGLRYDSLADPPVFYVAPPAAGGNDANTGDKDHPWATLQHAADQVMPGDSVVVMPGEYTGFHLQTGGLAGQPITFAAQPGAYIVDSNANAENGHGHTPDGINIENWDAPPAIGYVRIEGFIIDGDRWPDTDGVPGPDARPRTGIRIAGSPDTGFAHHIEIRNNVCLNCREWGILTGHADDMVIEGNECAYSRNQHGIYHSNSGDRALISGNILHDNFACGLHMNGDLSSGGDGIISNCVIENNVVYGNGAGGGSGINCDCVQDSTIRNNLLFDNHASGISLYQIDGAEGSTGNFITNNTIIQANDGRWGVNIRDASTGVTLRNNILLTRHSFRGGISLGPDCVSGFTSDSNATCDRFTLDDGDSVISLAAWQGSTGQDAGSINATPAALFINPLGSLAEDYLLKAGSPAINAGGAQNAPNTDLRNVPRPAGPKFDIGCFEMAP